MALPKRLALAAALVVLAALVATLGGCAGYNDAVRDINKSRDEHPRVARVKLTPMDPSKPAQVVNGVLEAEIPLDAWQQPQYPDSPGKQVGQVLEKATPLGAAVATADAIKSVAGQGGGNVQTKDSHDVAGSYNQDRHDVVEGSEAP